MGRKISGTALGTAADLFIGLEAIPDRFYIKNMTAAAKPEITWYKNAHVADGSEGIFRTFDGTQMTEDELDFGQGVSFFRGGNAFSSAQTAYLLKDGQFGLKAEKRDSNTAAAVIDTWTLDTAANRTGHVNAEVSTTHVGLGSTMVIRVGDKVYGGNHEVFITGLTSNGEAADEIELNEAVPSGEVLSVGGKVSYVGAPAGSIMPAGVAVKNTTVNASGELLYFEAEFYD